MKKIILLMVIFSSCVFSAEASTVGLWTFDEASGNTAYDSSGSGNNGVIYGATRTSDTPFSYLGNFAMSFDGLNDYINCGSSPALDLTTFTLEAWIKPETVGYRYIAAKGHKYAIELLDGTARPQSWYTTDNDVTYHIVTSPDTIPLNTWSHIATTKDGADLKLYVNGQQKGTLHGPYGAIIQHNDDFYIGDVNLVNYFTSYYFDGLIDEVRVSDVALTPEQLGYYQSFGTPIPEPSSLLLLSFGLLGAGLLKRRKK